MESLHFVYAETLPRISSRDLLSVTVGTYISGLYRQHQMLIHLRQLAGFKFTKPIFQLAKGRSSGDVVFLSSIRSLQLFGGWETGSSENDDITYTCYVPSFPDLRATTRGLVYPRLVKAVPVSMSAACQLSPSLANAPPASRVAGVDRFDFSYLRTSFEIVLDTGYKAQL